MKLKMELKVVLVLAGMGASCLADTFYVATNGVDAVGNGSESSPFGTIQYAADTASPGDTILVAPGIYDKGGKSNGFGMNRVFIEKRLTIRATGKKEETHIVGAHDAGGNEGIGPDAVRCIGVTTNSVNLADTIIEGFTIRDGAAFSNVASLHSSAVAGGGFYAPKMACGVYLVGCVVSNCVSRNGGGIYGGVAVRSLITDCTCLNMGSAGRECGFWNSIIIGNNKSNTACEGCYAVNTTIVGNNSGRAIYDGGKYRNCIITCNSPTASAGNGSANNADTKGSTIAVPNECPACEGAVLDASPYQIMAPVLGDFRVVKGSAAETSGRAEYMDNSSVSVPSHLKYVDYNGNPIPQTGTIMAGCMQETAAPAAGAISLFRQNAYSVLGIPNKVDGLWIYPESYPTQIQIRADGQSNPVFAYGFGYGSIGVDSYKGRRAPQMDDSIYVMPPPDVSSVITVKVYLATAQYYVNPDPSIGSDSNNGRSPGSPFRTLKKACETVSSGAYSIVHAAAGTYGSSSQGDCSTAKGYRFRFAHAKSATTYVRFKGAGADRCFIEGEPDEEDPTVANTSYRGCGSNAVAGVYMSAPGVVQGFTFRNCYAALKDGTADSYDGGAIYVENSEGIVADCIVTNCFAKRGACGFGGIAFERCRFRDCYGWNGVFRSTRYWSSCLIDGCTGYYGVCYEASQVGVVGCTGVMRSPACTLVASSIPVYNSILVRSPSDANGSFKGSVLWRWNSYPAGATGFITEDPLFMSDDDRRVLAISPAVSAGAAPAECGEYYAYATTDVDGRPLAFVDGAPVPGCHQRTVTTVTVAAPPAGTLSNVGTNAVEAGASLAVELTPGAKPRRFLGFEVNGELAQTPSASLVLTAPAAGQQGIAYNVNALYDTNFYVNAVAGDNSRDGLTPETAKKTLQAVFEDCEILEGDCVHAAEGDYCEGTMANAALDSNHTGCTTNRVVVPDGVTLMADGDRALTIIRGRAAVSGGDEYGRGPGGLRCVFLEKRARLVGFTVTDGSVGSTGTTSGDDTTGGGVLCRVNTPGNADASWVEDCVVTNCAGYRGGGGFGCNFVRCLLVGNKARMGAAGRQIALYGCIVRDSVGTIGNCTGDRGVEAPCRIENCTFGPGERCYEYSSAPRTIVNSVFLDTNAKFIPQTGVQLVASNCYFAAGAIQSDKMELVTFCGGGVVPAEDLSFDAEMRPIRGSCVAVDGGLNEIVSPLLAGKTDALGGQRIYNGVVDAGAIECDWRSAYAATLGGAAAVDMASPTVTNGVGAVCLIDGSELAATWLKGAGIRGVVQARVDGEGTLDILRNGEPFVSVAAADSLKKFTFTASGADSLRFAFSGSGHAELLPFATRPGFTFSLR